MKRLIGLTAALILTTFLVAAANADSQETTETPQQETTEAPKQETAETPELKQGIINARKSVQNQLELNKKANENFQKGNAQRQQALSPAQ